MNHRSRPFLILLACLLASLASSSSAQVVAVTLRLDTNQIPVGGSTQLHVEAQILPAYRNGAYGIFSWYVDVLNTNGAIASANYTVMQKTASDNDPDSSSIGTADGASQRGIYDTFLDLPGAGLDAPVELMTIPITGLAVGQTRFEVQAGTGVPELSADFLVAVTNAPDPLTGGDYSAASVDLTVLLGHAHRPASDDNQREITRRFRPGNSPLHRPTRLRLLCRIPRQPNAGSAVANPARRSAQFRRAHRCSRRANSLLSGASRRALAVTIP